MRTNPTNTADMFRQNAKQRTSQNDGAASATAKEQARHRRTESDELASENWPACHTKRIIIPWISGASIRFSSAHDTLISVEAARHKKRWLAYACTTGICFKIAGPRSAEEKVRHEGFVIPGE